MYSIKDIEILQKIIELQSHIIKGTKIDTLLSQNQLFFLQKSSADRIIIYMHEDGHINTSYLLEKEKLFASLLKKYLGKKGNFSWQRFVINYDIYFQNRFSFYKIKNCFELFKGYISKDIASKFTKELNMSYGQILPLYDYDQKEKIGYVCFIFNSDRTHIDINTLRAIRTTLEILLRPLYDKNDFTLYTKCIRIDEDMKILTSQEKKIIQKVLNGDTYPHIAESLGISINTLKTHIKNIFNKYNVRSKIELYKKLHFH